MPRNKTGGRKAKKKSSKYENEFDIDEKNLIKPDDYQEYGIITKVLGSSRLLVDCATKVVNEDGEQNVLKSRMCTIRGKLKKRNWMNVGDIVIVSLRDFNEGKDGRGDIIHKFSVQQAYYLKKQNIIQFELTKRNDQPNQFSEIPENENGDFDFEDDSDNENTFVKNNVSRQRVMDFPPSESSDEDDESDNVDIDYI